MGDLRYLCRQMSVDWESIRGKRCRIGASRFAEVTLQERHVRV